MRDQRKRKEHRPHRPSPWSSVADRGCCWPPGAATTCRSRRRWSGRACWARASRSRPIRGGRRSCRARPRRSPGSSPGRAAPATLDWAFALCTTGGGDCADAPQPIGTGSGAPVTVAFTTPDAATLGTNLLPLMLGVVCADGTIGVDPNTPLPHLHGRRRERNDRALHRAGHSRRRDAQPPPRVRQRRHRAGRRGVGSGDRDGGGAGRRVRRDHRAAGRRRHAGGQDAVIKQQIRIVSDGDDRETFTPDGATVAAARGAADLELHHRGQVRVVVRGDLRRPTHAPTPT